MRAFTVLLILLISRISQAQISENDRFLTYHQNENWLKEVQSLTKPQQLEEIKLRFFSKENCNTQLDSLQYSPLIVVNGVALNVPQSLNDQYIGDVLSILKNYSIEITIVDKLSEQWIFCKPFAGVILMTMDERAGNKLLKLSLR